MTLEQLRALLKQKLADAKTICDSADADNNGEMTEEQETQYDELMASVDSVKKQIDRKLALDEREGYAQQSGGRQADPAPAGSGARAHDNRQDDPTAGFDTIADFSLAVRSASVPGGGEVDERLQVLSAPSNFHRESGSSDGYEVPVQFRNRIIEVMTEMDDLANMVDTEPTAGNAVTLLADESTPWGSTGIQAHWAAEGQQMDPSRLETEGRTVKLAKLYAFVLATDELLEDAPRLNQRLTVGAARAIQWKRTEAFIYGTGSGQPLGYMNAPALISVGKEGGQTADTIVSDNIAKMYSRLMPSSLSRGVWMVNSDILPQLMHLKIGDNLIWTPPSSGFNSAPGGLLLGRPIRFTEHAKTLGDKGDIQLIDPMGYYAPTKQGGVKFDSSIHLYFDYGVQAFRWTFRQGGQPYLSAPMSPNNGSATKSHFVTLDERT